MKNIFKMIAALLLDSFSSKAQATPAFSLDTMILKQFVHNEAIYRNQAWKFRRSTNENRIVLGEILSQVFELKESDVISMGVSSYNIYSPDKPTNEVLTDQKSIWNFDLFSCVLKHKDPETGYYSHQTEFCSTLFLKTSGGNIVLSLTGYSGAATEAYMRCSIMAMDDQSNGKAEAQSFILAHSEASDGSLLTQYIRLEENTAHKLKSGENLDDVEMELLNGAYEFKYNFYTGYGEWLFEQKRFYDAYTMLMRAYTQYKENYNFTDAEAVKSYIVTCDDLCWCLCHQGRYEEANFFLKESVLGTENFDVLSKKIAEKRLPVAVSDNSIPIGFALNLLFGVMQKNIVADVAVYNFETNSFENIQAGKKLSDIVLNSKEARNKAFLLVRSFAQSHTKDEDDSSILCFMAPLVMVAHDVEDDSGKPLTKVDAMACNFETNDDKRTFEQGNVPEHYTFIVGQDEVRSFDNSKAYDEINAFCDDLQKSHRIMEEYKLCQDYFNYRNAKITKDSNMPKDKYAALMADVCYSIGWSLMDLGKMEMAEYYLSIASSSMDAQCIQEHINCLTNLRSPRAMKVIDWAMNNSAKPEDAEYEEAWKSHMAFLKRRKAYVLIDQNRLDEAKTLLEKMLQDPLCHDFAVKELEYINNQMSNQK